MADKKITDLTEMGTGVLATADVFAVVDVGSGETKKIQSQYISEGFTTAFTRTLLDDTTAAIARTTLGVGDLGTLPMAAMADLKHLLYPSVSGGYGELYINGWKPIGFNQQWGGPWGGDRPNGDGNQEWFPTGYIEESQISDFLGNNAASTWSAQGFKVPETITADAVWCKMSKAGNPQKNAEPMVVYICPDTGGGEPDEASPITNGTMDTMDGPGFAGESMASAAELWPIRTGAAAGDGAWYRFTDASGSFSLTKDTQYYVVWKATGADAANYFNLHTKNATSNAYPHGNRWSGDDATPSNWAEDTSAGICFLIESSSGTDLLQGSGVFDGMLEFGEGTPTNESRCIQRPLKDFFDDEEFSMRLVTGALTASKTLLDLNYGLLHKDRVLLRVDGSNHLVFTIYESDGTAHTITGTTNVTTSATWDIMLGARTKADGSDTVSLYVNGATEGTQLTSKTITISPLLRKLGRITLGGGFPVAPTWTKDYKTDQLANGDLPSNDADTAWTTTTAATEASAMMIINDDTLYQNYAYYATGNEDGYYRYSNAFAAATGFYGCWKLQVSKVVNTQGELACWIMADDDTERIYMSIHEYYVEFYDGATYQYVQHDFVSQPTVISAYQKGSVKTVMLNGKVVWTSTVVNASGGNTFDFGDSDTTAGSEADVVWSEVLCYASGTLAHEVNGCQLSEFACWAGDQTGIADDLYNSGTNLSVKQVCGISKNYIEKSPDSIRIRGVESSPTTTSTSAVICPEMELFMLCSGQDLVDIEFSACVSNNSQGNASITELYADGEATGAKTSVPAPINTYNDAVSLHDKKQSLVGLHKFETRWYVSAQTATTLTTTRILTVRDGVV